MFRKVVQRLASTVTVVKGDGIGPEVIAATQKVAEAAGAQLNYEDMSFSEIKGTRTNENVNNFINSVKKNKVALMGHVAATEEFQGFTVSMPVEVSKKLGLFAKVIPVKSFKGLENTKNCRHPDVDFVVIREVTEGEYAGKECEYSANGGLVANNLKVTTTEKTRQVATFAFEYARRHNRKKVTCIHKANIMKQGDGLFMRVCTDVAENYPDIEYETMIVDNTCMQLTSNPWQFDVMVMPNLYGNIIENLGAGLVGGTGGQSGKHQGDNGMTIYGPGARYTYFSGVGKDTANPTAMFRSMADLLRDTNVNQNDAGNLLENATRNVIARGTRTKDFFGSSGLTAFTDEVVKEIQSLK